MKIDEVRFEINVYNRVPADSAADHTERERLVPDVLFHGPTLRTGIAREQSRRARLVDVEELFGDRVMVLHR